MYTIILIDNIKCVGSHSLSGILKVGQQTLLKCLRDKGIFDHRNIPVPKYRGIGIFLGKVGRHNTITTYYTVDKGIDFVKNICKDLPRKKYKPYIDNSIIGLEDVIIVEQPSIIKEIL